MDTKDVKISSFEVTKKLAMRPSKEQAKAALRLLLAYIGDDPDRDGLLETPERVINSFAEIFKGYRETPEVFLERVFLDNTNYREPVLIKDIPFYAHCEHHMMVFSGLAHISYLPNGRIVGLSKVSRVVDVFAKRLQTQENLTLEIAEAIERGLKPLGVAVLLEAEHQCMTIRGVHKHGSKTMTSHFTGQFDSEQQARDNFIKICAPK